MGDWLELSENTKRPFTLLEKVGIIPTMAIVTFVIVFGIIYPIDDVENCKTLINSERVKMEGDPSYKPIEDLYFVERWVAENYQCDRFFDYDDVLRGFPKGDRV